MKTLCFLHRRELTDLFGPVSRAMLGDIRCVHLAYDRPEAERLAAMGITGVPVFKQLLTAHLKNATRDPGRLAEIDRDIVQATGGAFSLNSAIQSDRGFTLLPYADCLRLASAYYAVWETFIDAHQVDYVLHEPVSLMFNFMAAVALARRGGSYLYCIMAQAEPGDYDFMVMSGVELTCPDLNRALAHPGQTIRPQTRSRADLEAFLARFRGNIANFQGGVITQSVSFPLLAAKALRNVLRRMARLGKTDPLIGIIDWWELQQNVPAEKIRNLRGYRSVRFDQPDPSETYWFYPFHLEPEAVVLYQAHGLYTGQVKLIENIAAQLPPGHFLYVKDHPHDIGYRAAEDYKRLNAVPNIRLLRSNIPGKQVIRDARGVITITGTAGFEAMLMGKPVVVFGRTFYSAQPGVVHLDHIRDLRAALAELDKAPSLQDGPILDFLAAYLGSIHPGMTDFFAGQAGKTGLDPDENARKVADGLAQTLRAL
jgi:hypothetical protein